MRIFLFEHMSGGGMVDRELPRHLVGQGAAMLRAVAQDFMRAGHTVMTTLDARVVLDLGQAQVLRAHAEDRLDDVIDQLAAEADRALVIAPEWVGVLEHWTSKLTAAGARRLGSAPEAIKLCSDKYAFAQRLSRLHVPAVRTVLFEQRDQIQGPAIVKLRHGAGCDNTFRVPDTRAMRTPPWRGRWIAQPYIEGIPVSVSMIVVRHIRRILPAGRQIIQGEGQLSYHGNEIPLPEALSQRATALAERAVAAVPGLRGWCGVDLILADDPIHDVVIEINPRITMSYIGLQRLCRDNMAVALMEPEAPLRFRSARVVFDANGVIQLEESLAETV
jgi:predicted ATP-grasp superfamily ATP-dependent carboligase